MRLSALLPAFVLLGLLVASGAVLPAAHDTSATRLSVTPLR